MLFALSLAMLSCTEVLVKNTTQAPVRVQIYMPGWTSFESRRLDPNDSYMFQAEEEGTYFVSAVADDEYIAECKQVREDLTYLLTTNADMLSNQELQNLLLQITNLKDMINKMNAVGCSGEVTRDNTPVVTISLNQSNNVWTIVCHDQKD
ncbi:MAG: hypothetical protein JW757_01850 [Anaerolineales bacterium]|nr:hypothetical protein [Anaerolineales bacterium]